MKKFLIALAIVFLVLASVLGVIVFKVSSDNQKIDNYLELGEKYLLKEDYEEAIIAYKSALAIDSKNVKAYENITNAYIALAESCDDTDEKLKYYREALSMAKQGSEVSGRKTFTKLIDEINEQIEIISSLSYLPTSRKDGYNVTIVQRDLSNFPTVRLYLDVRDAKTDELVTGLTPNMFIVSERDSHSSDFTRATVSKALLLNQNESLTLNMLADTSGSMDDYGRLGSAQSIMINFLNTMQFSVGDKIKLTQFNSYIDKGSSYTSDTVMLTNIINSYVASGQTKLYDTIVYAVQDISAENGAKCVIAFTDGMDVGSSNSVNDVVNIVSRYQVPVFIVRIGNDASSSENQALQSIANASGGSFRNIEQFNNEMSTLFNSFYRQMKEYYVVEYTTNLTQNLETSEVNVYIQDRDAGGESTVSMDLQHEMLDTLLGEYLRAFIWDTNIHKFNKLNQYVDETADPNDQWTIRYQMEKQISGGFESYVTESLMDYEILSVTQQDEDTIIMQVNENYDVIYEEKFRDIQGNNSELAQKEMAALRDSYGSLSGFKGTDTIRFWSRVNQRPTYVLKRINGVWKFSKYSANLSLNITNEIYYFEIV